VDYSFGEQFLLGMSELVLDAYHGYRDRPRLFWTTWTLAFAAAALLLLRPHHVEQ
jgi:hypothetical protein